MWFFGGKNKKKIDEHRDALRTEKVNKGQSALISAATSTAEVAGDVTAMLKSRLDDTIRQIEITAHLLTDALITCQSDGLIDTVNQAAERIFGWSREQIKGLDISSLFRDDMGAILPTAQVIHQFFLCRDDSLEMGITLDHIRGKRRNGELFWVEVNISHVVRADGSTFIILLCRDATLRMETQKALELNELRFRSMFEASLDGIFVTYNHHIVAANPAVAVMLGYSMESMIAQPLVAFISPEFRDVANTIHTLRMQGDTVAKSYVIKLLKSDKTSIDVLVSSTGMQWGGGRVASLMMLKNIGEFQ